MVDSTGNWPVYSFTMRNIGSICSKYLKLAREEGMRAQNETLLRRIRRLARTAKICDYQNKLTFHCICTELADKRLGINKPNTAQFEAKEAAFPQSMFSPVVIIAFQHEAQRVMPVLEFSDRYEQECIIVFLKEDNEIPTVSSPYGANTLLLTFVTPGEIFTQIDKLLMERLVFQTTLLPMTEFLSVFLQEFGFKDKRPPTKDLKNKAWQLLFEIQAMYERSEIPKGEHPLFSQKVNPELTKKFISKILKIPNVLGCGEVLGIFEIAVNNGIKSDKCLNTETIKLIEDACENETVNEFYVRYTSKWFKHYTSCGDEIGNEYKGTLGAFAKAAYLETQDRVFPNEKIEKPTSNLVALISKHVAIFQPEKKLIHDGLHIADILEPSVVEGVDIAAAQIREQYRDICQQVFKTQDGRSAPCLLLGNIRELQRGQAVHIWGAKSKPGLGKIISCNFALNDNFDDNTGSHFIVLKDKYNKSRFAQPGDSGSVICIASRDGTIIYAFCMLMGELLSCESSGGNSSSSDENSSCNEDSTPSSNKIKPGVKVCKKRYGAFEIKHGISCLNQAHKLEIEWLSTNQTQ